MRRVFRTATIILFCSVFPTFAQDSAARDDRWRGDLDALVGRITSVHPNPYTRTTPGAFREQVQQLRERIPALPDRQVVLGFARILASLNDGHSSINVLQAGTGIRRYPISFRWFNDGLFVTNAPEAKARLVGTKVIAIGGKPVDAVYEAIRPWLSYDTESWCRYVSQNALPVHDILVAAEIVAEGAALPLEVEGSNSQRFTEEIGLGAVSTIEGPVVSRYGLPLFRRQPAQDYWFDWLPAEKTLYLQYNRCRENPILSISAFAADVIAFSRENLPERFIFDLRENSGGSSIWFTQLLSFFRAAYESGQLQAPVKGVFGIIGKRTFSSGSLAVRDLQQAGIPLIGETTGGRVYWFGENAAWTLPNSGLSLTVSTRVIGNPAIGPEVPPDFPVPFTGADYFANRDPYLEHALTLDARALNISQGLRP